MKEYENWDKGCFITLTYDDLHLPSDNSLHKEDLQKFFKRLRKDMLALGLYHLEEDFFKPSQNRKVVNLKYFACGEYGETYGRPHYHAVLLGLSPSDSELIKENWQKGFVKIGTFTKDSCRYTTDYILKKMNDDSYDGKEPPFRLISQGIGKKFYLDNKAELISNDFYYMYGKKVPLPKYYRDLFKKELQEGNKTIGETGLKHIYTQEEYNYMVARAEKNNDLQVQKQVELSDFERITGHKMDYEERINFIKANAIERAKNILKQKELNKKGDL